MKFHMRVKYWRDLPAYFQTVVWCARTRQRQWEGTHVLDSHTESDVLSFFSVAWGRHIQGQIRQHEGICEHTDDMKASVNTQTT